MLLEIEEADDQLKSANDEIAELNQQLKEKPIDVQAAEIIEKIPDEVEKELNELRKSLLSTAALNFKFHFETLVRDFNNLLSALNDIETDSQDKYKNAVSGLIEKMSERL